MKDLHKSRFLPSSRCLRAGIYLLFALYDTAICPAQTPLEVKEATVTRSDGAVQIVDREGTVSDAYVGANLTPGQTLRTGANGWAEIALTGSGKVRMETDSELKLPEAKDSAPSRESLQMVKGRLFMNIDAVVLKKGIQGEFRLKTPAVILAVKGTKFFAFATAEGDTVGVHEGAVLAYEPQSKQTQQIRAGMASEASPNKLAAPRALKPVEREYDFMYPGAPVTGWVVPIGNGDRWLTIGFLTTANGDRYYRKLPDKPPSMKTDVWLRSRQGREKIVLSQSLSGSEHIFLGGNDLYCANFLNGGSVLPTGILEISRGKPSLVLAKITMERLYTGDENLFRGSGADCASFDRKADFTTDLQVLYFTDYNRLYRMTRNSNKKWSVPEKVVNSLEINPRGSNPPIGMTITGPNEICYIYSDTLYSATLYRMLDWKNPESITKLPVGRKGFRGVSMGVSFANEKLKP